MTQDIILGNTSFISLLPIFGVIFTLYKIVTRLRPKVIYSNSLEPIIDYDNNKQYLEKEFKIKWPKFCLPILFRIINGNGKLVSICSYIFLSELPKNANVEFYYYKHETDETKLPSYTFKQVNNAPNAQKIFLVTKKYFQDNDIKKLFMISSLTPNMNYRESIISDIQNTHITIKNYNSYEIINYSINLPNHIKNTMLDLTNDKIEIKKINDDSEQGFYIRLVINKLPKCQHNLPGNVTILLKPLS